MRNLIVFAILFLFVVISFLLWGDWFMQFFSGGEAINVLMKYGRWAWAVGILLLISDLFLPLPATLVMSALGYVYGPLVGGVLSAVGGFLSGMLAFGICKGLGLKGAKFILGEKDLDRGRKIFSTNGGWVVAISRWLPVLPEVISCMAGLNRMETHKFAIALLCGSLPLGFVFAYIGYSGKDSPYMATIVSAVLPLALWVLAQWVLRILTTRQRNRIN